MDLTTRADDAELVTAARAGDGQAFGALFDRWFDRVNDVAYRIVRDREVAAEVAQDTFLAAWTGLDRLEQVESFGGWLLRIARNRALNRLERERRSIPVGDEETTVLDRSGPDDDQASTEAARAEDAALVWTAAAALGPRDASVLDLHLRHGLSAAEIAEELGVAPNAAHQTLFRLRARLGDAVRACVLWRGGSPSCPTLGRELAAAGTVGFGSATARAIGAHATGCASCAARQEARLSPEALFAAAPLLVVGAAVREAVRRGLADAGVPVDAPSASVGQRSAGDAPADAVGTRAGKVGRARAATVAAAGVVALVIVALVLLAGDDSDDVEDVAATDPTSTSTTTTTGAPTSAPADDADAGPLVGGTATTSAPVGSLPAPAPTSTAPPTTAPADIGSVPTDPPLVVDPGSDPTTTVTTAPPAEPPTPDPPAADPPQILSFTATRTPGPGGCPGRPRAKISLSWRTAGADTITVSGPGAPSSELDQFGTTTACSLGASTYVLTATGPGGSVTQPVTVGPAA